MADSRSIALELRTHLATESEARSNVEAELTSLKEAYNSATCEYAEKIMEMNQTLIDWKLIFGKESARMMADNAADLSDYMEKEKKAMKQLHESQEKLQWTEKQLEDVQEAMASMTSNQESESHEMIESLQKQNNMLVAEHAMTLVQLEALNSSTSEGEILQLKSEVMSLTEQLNQAKTMLADVESTRQMTVDTLTADLKISQREVEENHATINLINVELEESKRQADEYHTTMDQIKIDLSISKRETEECRLSAGRSQQELDKSLIEIERINNELTNSRRKAEEHQETINRINGELESQSSEYRATIELIKSELTDCKRQNVESLIEADRNRIEYQADMERVKNELESSLLMSEDYHTNLEKMKHEAESNRLLFTQAKQDADDAAISMMSDSESSKKEMTLLREEVDRLTEELAKSHEDVEILRKEALSSSTSVSNLERELKDSRAEIANACKRIEAAEVETKCVKIEASEDKISLDKLQTELDSVKIEFNHLKDRYSKQSKAMAHLEEFKDDVNQKRALKRDTIANARTSLAFGSKRDTLADLPLNDLRALASIGKTESGGASKGSNMLKVPGQRKSMGDVLKMKPGPGASKSEIIAYRQARKSVVSVARQSRIESSNGLIDRMSVLVQGVQDLSKDLELGEQAIGELDNINNQLEADVALKGKVMTASSDFLKKLSVAMTNLLKRCDNTTSMFDAFFAGQFPPDKFKSNFKIELDALRKPLSVIQNDLAKHINILSKSAAPSAPPPPPVVNTSSDGKEPVPGRVGLLSSIRKGSTLRKVTANDITKMKERQIAGARMLAGNLEDTLRMAVAQHRLDLLEDEDDDIWDDDEWDS